jgi:hypothetical protein
MRDLDGRISRLEATAANRQQPEPSALFDAIAGEIRGYAEAKASFATHMVLDTDGTLVRHQPASTSYHFDPCGSSLLAQFCRRAGAPLPELHVEPLETDNAHR